MIIIMIYWAFIYLWSYHIGTVITPYPIWGNSYADAIWLFSECRGSTTSSLEWTRCSGPDGTFSKAQGMGWVRWRKNWGRIMPGRRKDCQSPWDGGKASRWACLRVTCRMSPWRRFGQRDSGNFNWKGNLGWTRGWTWNLGWEAWLSFCPH